MTSTAGAASTAAACGRVASAKPMQCVPTSADECPQNLHTATWAPPFLSQEALYCSILFHRAFENHRYGTGGLKPRKPGIHRRL